MIIFYSNFHSNWGPVGHKIIMYIEEIFWPNDQRFFFFFVSLEFFYTQFNLEKWPQFLQITFDVIKNLLHFWLVVFIKIFQ